MTRIKLISLGFVLLAACGELSRTPGVEDGGSLQARRRCDSATPGMICRSGERVVQCDSSQLAACSPGFRCFDSTCWRDVVPTCDDLPCNVDQFCFSAYCVAPTTRRCSATDDSECYGTEQCVPERGACVPLPPCNADGSCQLGSAGAFCNRASGAFVPRWTKHEQDYCVIGRCISNDHCPAPLTCQEIGAEVEGLGVCR